MLRGLGSFLLSTTTSGLMASGLLTHYLSADNLGSRSFLSRLLASLRARWGIPVTIVTSVLLGSLLATLFTANFKLH